MENRSVRSVRLTGLVAAACAGTAVATLLGYLGGLWWVFDLFSHFRVQYAALAAFVLAIGLAARFWLLCGGAALVLAVNGSSIAPLYGAPVPGITGGQPLTVLMLNANIYGGDPKKVGKLLVETTPDIVVLAEVDERWLTALGTALARYPYRLLAPRSTPFGIALLSTRPLADKALLHAGSVAFPSVIATVDWAGKPLTIVGAHPPPPFNVKMAHQRDAQLSGLAQMLGKQERLLLVGDLNATPWSHGYRALVEPTGLKNCAQGRGVLPTWPTHFWPLGIPIDHCLASPQIPIRRFWIGPDVGSDHAPIFIELSST